MNNLLFQQAVLSSNLNAQALTIVRSVGSFVAGRWTESSPEEIEISGVCYPSSNKELQMMPEGDRVTGAITFITVNEIFTTHGTKGSGSPDDAGISDKIEWNGEYYRVLWSNPFKDYGYYLSIGERIAGD